MDKLSPKQQRFVEEYLLDRNASQAAIRAGYASNNNSGYQLMQNPKIRQAVEQKLSECAKRAEVSGEQILRELAQVAFLNSADVLNLTDATIRENAPRNALAAVASVKVKSNSVGFEREVKFADKLKALELLAKCLGLFRGQEDSEVGEPVVILEDLGE